MVLQRGEANVALRLPKAERLEFDVLLNVAVIGDTRVGSFTLSAGVEPYLAGLPTPGAPVEADAKKAAWIKGEARGDYLGYALDHKIEARILPQTWPEVVYTDVQRGSENRRRELRYGLFEGEPSAWYRADMHCSSCERREHFLEGGWFTNRRHCTKCKRGEHRVWREPEQRDVPPEAVDMLSALYLARALALDELDEVKFPLLDKTKLWQVTLTRAKTRVIEARAGRYLCQQVKMTPTVPEGESHESKFKGLFGIHGTLSIWLERETGIPIRIEGIVPLGPFDLDVALSLRKATGTPEAFRPVAQ